MCIGNGRDNFVPPLKCNFRNANSPGVWTLKADRSAARWRIQRQWAVSNGSAAPLQRPGGRCHGSRLSGAALRWPEGGCEWVTSRGWRQRGCSGSEGAASGRCSLPIHQLSVAGSRADAHSWAGNTKGHNARKAACTRCGLGNLNALSFLAFASLLTTHIHTHAQKANGTAGDRSTKKNNLQ